LLSVSLAGSYWILAISSGLPAGFISLAFAMFCCMLVISFLYNSSKLLIRFPVKQFYKRQKRFNPVQILDNGTVTYSYSLVMIPFAIIALVFMFTGFAMPVTKAENIHPLPSGIITEADYNNHVFFQSTFSLRVLGRPDTLQGVMPVIAGYELGHDGLPSPVTGNMDNKLSQHNIPDFHLAALLGDLELQSQTAENEKKQASFVLHDLFSALLPLFFIFPAFMYWKKAGIHRRTSNDIHKGNVRFPSEKQGKTRILPQPSSARM
jgi:hypothetical protein